MKRKLLAVMMAVCMTASFAGGTATVFAAQEESTARGRSDRDYADNIRAGIRL